MEPSRLWMDVVAFLETRLSDSGSVMEGNFLFFRQGKSPDETREHGVGFYGQKYPAGIHHLICRWKRKRFLTTTPLISGSGISDHCLCPDSVIARRSEGYIIPRTGNQHQGNHWERATNCSFSMTSTPELVLIKGHGPLARVISALGRWAKTTKAFKSYAFITDSVSGTRSSITSLSLSQV